MHPAAVRARVLALAGDGVNVSDIARRTGVARTTVRDIRAAQGCPERRPLCPRCWRPRRQLSLTESDYAELLGLYLGDGYLSPMARTFSLRLFLDARHALVVREAGELLRRCFPENLVGHLRKGPRRSTSVVWVYSRHLPCLFPQHGPGKKHERDLILESWQWNCVLAAPWSFLRGCIRSDGCVYVNRTGPYSYLSYDFANRSLDLLELFARACALVGVECRLYAPSTRGGKPRAGSVRICRRASVRLLEQHVGGKR
jgi:hypothetical protein